MTARTAGRPVRILSWVIVAVLACFAVASISSKWESLRGSFGSIRWGASPVAMIASAILLAAGLALNPLGWLMIARELGARSSGREMIAAWFASQLGRYAPGKVWLFAGRIGYLRAQGMSLARSAAASVWEVLCSFAAVGLVAVPSILLSGGSGIPPGARLPLSLAAGSVLLLPILHPFQRMAFRWKGAGGFVAVRLSVSARAWGVYGVIWILRGVSLWLWLIGLGIASNGPAACMAAAPLAWLAGYIVVVVPGGIGVREAVTGALVAAPGLMGPVVAAALGQTVLMAAFELLLAFGFMKLATRKTRNGETDASSPAE